MKKGNKWAVLKQEVFGMHKSVLWTSVFTVLLVTVLIGGIAFGQQYKRSETLYTTGTMWGAPTSWNPLQVWSSATGTIGLCYEPLFLYNPLTDTFIPWLAKSGEWTNSNTYEVKLRKGIKWSDGELFTADDVTFTFELGKKYKAISYSSVWSSLKEIEKIDEYTLRFHFTNPLYQEWGDHLYTVVMLPEHLWKNKTEKDILSGANLPPVGTGPYLYDTHAQDRMVWVRNDNWWGTKLLGLVPAPRRIVDIVNTSNNVTLGMLLKGEIDLSNNFLSGIANLKKSGYPILTYYSEPPYMLSGGAICLIPNLTKKPMSDPSFRRAVAFAVDVNEIVTKVYGNLVPPANPSGLPLTMSKYVDKDIVSKLGFKYDPKEARQILADAGYKDVDGDGFVEAPDGAKIKLSIIVPSGWSDWMEAAKTIAQNCQAVGVDLEPEFPSYGAYVDARTGGTFDMLLTGVGGLSSTPWSFYDALAHHPILDQMPNSNFERYDNPRVFDLIDQLDRTPRSNLEAMKSICSQIQRIQLEDMPVIPLWYGAIWAQAYTGVWTNWPTAAKDTPNYLPVAWPGYWNMGAVLMLTELKSTK